MKKDKRIDDYIRKSADFAGPILINIRFYIHKYCPDIEETIKWGFPHFMFNGSILCSMASFKNHCAFGFWKGSLIPELNKPNRKTGETAMGQFGKIQTLKDLPGEKVFSSLIKKAVKLNEENVKLPSRIKSKFLKELVIPDYFKVILRKHKEAERTFESFSYSHKKEYVEWITEAKTLPTREIRIKQTIEWLCEGKDRNWKYK